MTRACDAVARGSRSRGLFLADVQRDLVLLLAPFAPYLAHELWETLGEKGSLLKAPGRSMMPRWRKKMRLEIPVQVNGKLRAGS